MMKLVRDACFSGILIGATFDHLIFMLFATPDLPGMLALPVIAFVIGEIAVKGPTA